MRYIGFEREDEAESWARAKMGLVNAPGFFRAMSAVDDNDDFVCVVVLTNFSSRNVDLSLAMEASKLRPKVVVEMYNAVFKFLFDTLRVVRVTGLVGISNTKAQKSDETFGFKREGLMRKAMPNDEDMIIYGFLKEEFHQHNWYR